MLNILSTQTQIWPHEIQGHRSNLTQTCAQSISSEVKASLIAFQVFQMNAGIDRAREREDICVQNVIKTKKNHLCSPALNI